MLYTMPWKKNALAPSEAACIEEYKVVSKEDGGWLVTLFVTTPKVFSSPRFVYDRLSVPYLHDRTSIGITTELSATRSSLALLPGGMS